MRNDGQPPARRHERNQHPDGGPGRGNRRDQNLQWQRDARDGRHIQAGTIWARSRNGASVDLSLSHRGFRLIGADGHGHVPVQAKNDTVTARSWSSPSRRQTAACCCQRSRPVRRRTVRRPWKSPSCPRIPSAAQEARRCRRNHRRGKHKPTQPEFLVGTPAARACTIMTIPDEMITINMDDTGAQGAPEPDERGGAAAGGQPDHWRF